MASSTRWTASTLRSLNELRDHFGFSQQLICGPITKVNLNIDLVLMNNARGIPLLSGSPPDYSGTEASCRKCDKEFNFVFERRRRCNHCGQLTYVLYPRIFHKPATGYSYCSSCSNYQALMPRDSGYDPVAVCAYCIEQLNSTSRL